jgi:malate dehydrogenase (quinone)
MLQLIERCFKDQLASDPWQAKLQSMIPSFGQSLAENAKLSQEVTFRSNRVLQLATAS